MPDYSALLHNCQKLFVLIIALQNKTINEDQANKYLVEISLSIADPKKSQTLQF